MVAEQRAFTLRFKDPETHRRLHLVAELLGVPMREIAEAAVGRELDRLGADLEQRLEHTLARIRSYGATERNLERDIDEFARAEAEHPDPFASVRADSEDVYGVGEIFADPMEHG